MTPDVHRVVASIRDITVSLPIPHLTWEAVIAPGGSHRDSVRLGAGGRGGGQSKET